MREAWSICYARILAGGAFHLARSGGAEQETGKLDVWQEAGGQIPDGARHRYSMLHAAYVGFGQVRQAYGFP